MADDSMLLNLDIGGVPIVARTNFKGGRWKDRLSARKSADHKRYRAEQGGAAAEYGPGQRTTERDEYIGRAPKRQRVEGLMHLSRSGGNGGKEVVSSLFTFNPKSQIASTDHSEEVPDTAPSNAPLPEAADDFTSLGLSPILVKHLLKKLELKAPTAIQKSTISQLLREDSDAFIQAETGSGKTLAYLLPILHRLLSVSKEQRQDRHSGLFAIVLAPTRELCRQIQGVLDSLLGCAHWLVAGSVTGGERKKSEKARLRKGLNILVATPGRLTDHLQNTSVLDISNVRWLVMDEGDRLMELGFELEIKSLVEALETRQKKTIATTPQSTDNGFLTGLPRRRVTVLCSATMKMNVQRLGEVSLKDAVHIQASLHDHTKKGDKSEAKFTAPAQMKQSYIIVPAKQRLVTLAALLRKTFARKGSVMKAIVFFSCADSVDFHFEALRRGAEDEEPEKLIAKPFPMPEAQQIASPPPSSPELAARKTLPSRLATAKTTQGPLTSSLSPLLTSSTNPKLTIFRLHGSLAQPVRTSTLRTFSRSHNPGILLCTDVASRGLDLPSIDLVVEYDPAFSAEDHLHRVGRTARAGREGRAILFLMPGPEEGYVKLLETEGSSEEGNRKIGRLEANDILRRGLGEYEAVAKSKSEVAKVGKGRFAPTEKKDWEQKANEWQLETERWVIEDRRALELARKAYISHVRAYATHVVPERHMFNVKELHLGHLAKAFALRDRPGNMSRGSGAAKGGRSIQDARERTGANDDEGVRVQQEAAPDADVMAKMRKLARARERDMAGEFNVS